MLPPPCPEHDRRALLYLYSRHPAALEALCTPNVVKPGRVRGLTVGLRHIRGSFGFALLQRLHISFSEARVCWESIDIVVPALS
jgi:hypothetical protein